MNGIRNRPYYSQTKGGKSMAFWVILAVAAVLSAAVLAWFSPIRFRIRYSRSGQQDQLVIIVRALFGIVQFQSAIPSIIVQGFDILYQQKNKSTAAGLKTKDKRDTRRIGFRTIRRMAANYRMMLDSVRQFKTWFRSTMRKVECTRWRLDIGIGLGDAALTGVAAGLAWSLLGCAAAVTGQFVSLKAHPHGSVTPNYQGEELSIVWEADFRIRFGTVLASLVLLGRRTVRLAKFVRALQIGPSKPKHA